MLRSVAICLLLGSTPAFAADPFTLFVLRMLRDQAITSALESGVGAVQQPSRPGLAAPPALQPPDESQRLRRLIDESFVHLSARQREELHASLMRMLNDPKNGPMRAEIVGVFIGQAVAMRDAHRHLARLTEADLRLIAADARVEFVRLPPEERRQMIQALCHGVPGMPQALSEMLLAEFDGAAAR
jgi:hypothetical protein